MLKIEKKWETTGKNCALDPQPGPKDRSRLRHISSGAPLSRANLSCHDVKTRNRVDGRSLSPKVDTRKIVLSVIEYFYYLQKRRTLYCFSK